MAVCQREEEQVMDIFPGEEDGHRPPAFFGLHPIGTIRTPFHGATGTPIQPLYSRGAEGEVHLDQSLVEALTDLEGFDRIWLLYWMDRVGKFEPVVIPYRDTRPHGLFATRSPCRPNPIGLSLVRLLGRDGHRLRVADVDMLDRTPLLDIKPYVPLFDARMEGRAGWFDEARVDRHLADDRFHNPTA